MPKKKIEEQSDENEIINDATEETENLDTEQDLVFEDEEDSVDDDTLKKLRVRLKQCTEEKTEYLTGWQRAKADFINTRKEDEKTMANRTRFATESLIIDLLPVLDSFDMAFAQKSAMRESQESPKNSRDGARLGEAKKFEDWAKGIEHIRSQLLMILANNQVEVFDPINQVFDPIRHMSVKTIECDDKGLDNTVAEVLQKGYTLADKILRPARVSVYEYSEQTE